MFKESMKYVIVRGMFGGEYPVLLTNALSHDTLYRGVISAGFVDIVPINDGRMLVIAYGSSVSLNKDSREDTDAELICRELNKCTRNDEYLFVTHK